MIPCDTFRFFKLVVCLTSEEKNLEDILSGVGVVTSHGVPLQPCSLKSPALETPAFLEAVTHRLAKDPSPFVGIQVLFLKRLFFLCSAKWD